MMEDGGTFKTGVDLGGPVTHVVARTTITASPIDAIFSNDHDISLPNGVNFVALRETFLSEAPFVKRSNRPFWKRIIDSRQFSNIFSGTMRMVTECVLDNGTVDAKKLFIQPAQLSRMAMQSRTERVPLSTLSGSLRADATNKTSSSNPVTDLFSSTSQWGSADPYGFSNSTSRHHVAHNGREFAVYQSRILESIATNIAEMLLLEQQTQQGTRTQDIIFQRMPELLVFMIVNACIYALPKLTRLFYAIRFRELVLDYLCELIGGLRLTNCKQGREWLFKDAFDTAIVIVDPPINLSTSLRQFAHISAYALAKKTTSGLQRSASISAINNNNNNNNNKNNSGNNPKGRAKSLIASQSMSGLPPLQRERGNSLHSTMTDHNDDNDDDNDISSKTRHGRNMSIENTQLFGDLDRQFAGGDGGPDGAHEDDDEEQRWQQFTRVRCSGARSCFLLNNSPIVSMYLNSTRGAGEGVYHSKHSAKVRLTHFPARPALSMQPEHVLSEGKFREKKIDSAQLQATLTHSSELRKEILQQQVRNTRDMRGDVRKLATKLRMQLDMLDRTTGNGNINGNGTYKGNRKNEFDYMIPNNGSVSMRSATSSIHSASASISAEQSNCNSSVNSSSCNSTASR